MEFNGCLDGFKPETVLNDIDNDLAEEDRHDWYDAVEFENENKEEVTNGAFCFETDHAAIRGNSDYDALLRSLSILEVQRIKTIKDIEKLEKMLLEVKYNARGYLNKIVNGDTSDFPTNIDVEKVPEINWEKYRIKEYNAESTSDHNTVPKTESVVKKKVSCPSENNTNTMIVRGRIYDQTKPQTFNQLWTAEEQLRLEELLLEYPPESNENNRWRKIAQALGNRTTKQVCSRVQKYFKKLNKAGLPIPGHQLKTNTITSLKKKHRRTKKYKQKQSTFFPTDHLDAHNHLDECGDEDETVAATPILSSELKADIIEKVIEYKRKDALLSPFSHPGIKCGICGEEPLCGTRWTCLVCQTVNLCSDCVIAQLSANPPVHPPNHPLEPLTNPSVAHWDPDYTPQSFKSNNYLDPNFVTPNVI